MIRSIWPTWEEWEKTRAQGRTHFIIFYGVARTFLAAGMLIFLLLQADSALNFVEPGQYAPIPLKHLPIHGWAIIAAIVAVVGILVGAVVWHVQERGYRFSREGGKAPALRPLGEDELHANFITVYDGMYGGLKRVKWLGLVIFIGTMLAINFAPRTTIPDENGRFAVQPWYVTGLGVAAVVAAASVILYIIRCLQKGAADCRQLGVLCPKCGFALVGFSNDQEIRKHGRCTRCKERLFDGTETQIRL